MGLALYTIFHLNLAYSSIEEEDRGRVIERCYWPLLRLAKKLRTPIGIEASGYTLESILAIEPAWIRELRRLQEEGLIEFVGSGYSQLIGPLVPPEVNAANQRIGQEVYQALLRVRPALALVNEQAYSPGLIQHYLDAGYRAIVMDWENPAMTHPEWDPEWRYLPQYAGGQRGERIALLWSHSIAFQKLQRYAHGEMEQDEYLAYLEQHLSSKPRAFPLYSNDAEVFDFRPGRFETEAELSRESEWERLGALFARLAGDDRFAFVLPSRVPGLLKRPGAGRLLHLESAGQPVPVKKQGKYNVIRWAVTGPDDLRANTECHRLFDRLKAGGGSEADWKELCYLWSSDFRTHITRRRWEGFWKRLEAFSRRLAPARAPRAGLSRPKAGTRPRWRREGRFIIVETDRLLARFKCQKGLALDAFRASREGAPSLCGTLEHGYYDSIALGADWYTGHAVLEAPGMAKITDLAKVEPSVEPIDGGGIAVRATIPTALGPVKKAWRIYGSSAELRLDYEFAWPRFPAGAFRLGHVTLNPEAFDRRTLWYRAANGGFHAETLRLDGSAVDHGAIVSSLVSAANGLGMTSGRLEVGDARHSVFLEADMSLAAPIGMVAFEPLGRTFFCRILLSLGEIDEAKRLPRRQLPLRVGLRIGYNAPKGA